MQNKTLRQYLELELHTTSKDNPFIAEFFLKISDDYEKIGRHDLAQEVASLTLDLLIAEARPKENFSLTLDKKITERKIIQAIKLFYKQQGFECSRESARNIRVYSENYETRSYFFRQNDKNIEVAITRRIGTDELKVSANYKKK